MSQKSKIKSKLNGNELDLSLMDFKEVPVKDLATVPKGTHIDLSCNHLTCVPASFCDLTYIVQLDLSKNQIKELPDNFGNLRNLQRLDLFSNQLTILPESFYKLERLKWLDVKDNPLDAQLKEVAGAFITSEDYRWCAKKIVEFMTNVHNELEKDRERRRNKQQNKVASKKAKEEARQEKLRQEKKAAKEKRRVEIIEQNKQQQQKSKEQRKTNQQIKLKNDLKSNKTAKDRSKQTKQKTVENKKSSFANWFWVLALAILIYASLLWRYTGNNFTKDEVIKATIAIGNDALHLIQDGRVIGKQILLQMMQSLKDFTEFTQELWRKM